MVLLFQLLLATSACEPLPVPTHVEVYAYDLGWDAEHMPCMPTRDNPQCDKAKKPVRLSPAQTIKLSQVLRDSRSYRGTEQMKCFEPRHTLVFYYGSSLLDAYEVCLACHNLELEGSNPFAGCAPPRAGAQKRFTFTEEAYDAVRAALVAAKVKYVQPDTKD